MNLTLSTRFIVAKDCPNRVSDDFSRGEVLCFKHAVKAAIIGYDVEVEVDEQGDGNDMRTWHCEACNKS